MVAVVARNEEDEVYEAIFTTEKKIHRSMMAVAVVLRPPWGPAPGAKAYNNQQTYFATGRRC